MTMSTPTTFAKLSVPDITSSSVHLGKNEEDQVCWGDAHRLKSRSIHSHTIYLVT